MKYSKRNQMRGKNGKWESGDAGGIALWIKMLAFRRTDPRLGSKTHTVEGNSSRLSSDLHAHAVMLMSTHIHAKQITKYSVSNH